VRRKYGDDRVANIITFGTLGGQDGRSATWRACTTCRSPRPTASPRLIPDELNITLEDALDKSRRTPRAKSHRNPVAKSIIDQARVLEGMVAQHRQARRAASSSPSTPLDRLRARCTLQEGDRRPCSTTWTRSSKLGLLKMDFLGLKTLTVIDDAVANIARKHRGSRDFDIETRAARRPARPTRLLNDGQDHRRVPARIRRACRTPRRQVGISDASTTSIALIALYRPGPMAVHPRLRRGKKDATRDGRLPAPAARAGPARDLRHHGLPGAGDGGRQRDCAATRSAAPTCCAARWARRTPRRWRSERVNLRRRRQAD
jgi:DNA polymerase-3 subunit alpha